MQENGFWDSADSQRATVRNVLGAKKELPAIISVSPDDTLKTAIELFHRFNISQIPVLDGARSVGSLQESTLLALVFDGVNPANQRVGVVMGKPLPTLDMDADISEAYRLLLAGMNALIVVENGTPRSIVTRIDLIDYYMRRTA
jgi:cystathionine beta-synthase